MIHTEGLPTPHGLCVLATAALLGHACWNTLCHNPTGQPLFRPHVSRDIHLCGGLRCQKGVQMCRLPVYDEAGLATDTGQPINLCRAERRQHPQTVIAQVRHPQCPFRQRCLLCCRRAVMAATCHQFGCECASCQIELHLRFEGGACPGGCPGAAPDITQTVRQRNLCAVHEVHPTEPPD